jgi:phosphatidate cytidylyltransferase
VRARIITGVVGVPALLVILSFLPAWATAAAVAVIAAVAAYEILAAAGVKSKIQIAATLLFAALLVINPPGFTETDAVRKITAVALFIGSAILFAAILWLTLEVFRGAQQIKIPATCYFVIGGIVIPHFLSYLVLLRSMPRGRFLVLIPFIAAFLADAGAYFTGIFFGRHKAFSNISPKKTVEGCIGGLVVGVAAVCVYGAVINTAFGLDVSAFSLVVLGLLGAIAAVLGDLAFSLIKRERGIKDYGRILPGHGGMLDRFDSMALCAPVIYWLTLLFPPF